MSPPVCTVCGDELSYHRACDESHPGVCHPCAELNLRGGFDTREHLAPAPALVLSARDVQALVRYRLHREAVLGTGPCTPVVREEDA